MAFSIDDIRAQLTFGGARPTLFQVVITTPPGGVGASAVAIAKIPFLVQAASVPESQLGTIQVPYFGRKIKVAGDRTFQPWTINVIDDEDHLIRNFFETWLNQINSHESNLLQFGSATPSLYQATAIVTQFSKTGVPIRSYEMVGLWPNQSSPIELNWNANDQLITFNVTMEYDYWVPGPGITGNIGTL